LIAGNQKGAPFVIPLSAIAAIHRRHLPYTRNFAGICSLKLSRP